MRGYSAAGTERRVGCMTRIVQSSIGSKFVLAVTGLLLLGFLIMHLLGNLQILLGPDAINGYSQWLHDHKGLLVTARIGLGAVFVLHVWTAIRLALENRAARPTRYRIKAVVQATFSSRTMVYTGLLVLAYLVYHLLHFTLHTIDTGAMGQVDATGNIDIYSMVVAGFQHPAVAISYIVATLLLGLHLWHAIGSMFQTLGWDHPAWNPIGRALAVGLPILITIGYIVVPCAIWFGIVS